MDDLQRSVGPSLLVRVEMALLETYRRRVSPLLGPRCRFWPTCSVYASEALTKYGFLKGNVKTMWRLLRCAPWSPGGEDPP
ncbi:MAG: membrane protein insertion efficiency factor YidD [Candidatus Riflebacteria bacterium]|nr:membrane protein insertion efficiency factor YidD [Candidatus Riflebacteria bacterium]